MVSSIARPILLACLVALAGLVAGGGPRPVLGSSFTVSATHDAIDAMPGDGICADAGGSCTLRAAVMETNALPGADEISLSEGTYPLSLGGAGEDAAATGDLDVTDSLTITGAGDQTTAIDADGIDRVLHVSGSATELNISGITLTGGNLEPAFEPSSLCFPLHHGGGGVCITSGHLNLSDAEVRGNHSDDHGGGILIGELGNLTAVSTDFHENSSLRSGGAFSNFGTATVSNASISGNTAPAGGGVRNTGEVPGVNGLLTIENTTVEDNQGAIGGGIDNGFGGHLTVDGSTIAGNGAATGGGIYNSGGIPDLQADHAEMTLSDTVVRGNSAAFGGGIYNAGNDTPGIATIGGATIADNESSRFGGGMYNAGNLDLTASTISGNRAVLGGGGLFNAGADVVPTGERAQATLMNTTVSSNDGGQTGGGISNRGAVTATNVTVARNAAEDGGNFSRSGLDISEFENTIFADPQSSTNCNAGPPLSLGHNLDSDGTLRPHRARRHQRRVRGTPAAGGQRGSDAHSRARAKRLLRRYLHRTKRRHRQRQQRSLPCGRPTRAGPPDRWRRRRRRDLRHRRLRAAGRAGQRLPAELRRWPRTYRDAGAPLAIALRESHARCRSSGRVSANRRGSDSPIPLAAALALPALAIILARRVFTHR